MQHLPKQALFLGRALKECLDCSLQPLPDELNILLEMLEEPNGATYPSNA